MTRPIEDLTPMEHAAHNRCFGCGRENAGGLLLEFLLAADGSVVCLPTIPDRFEGHPGYLHGGIIATLLDEAMSKAVRARGLAAMTRHLEIEYLRPVPSGVELRVEGKLVRGEGRKHWSESRILSESGVILATGKGLFVEVRASRLTAGQPQDRPAAFS